MEVSTKRQRLSPPTLDPASDFIPLSAGSEGHPREQRHQQAYRSQRYQAGGQNGTSDRPKSRHNLPGYEPWVLVKTKLRRRFVYNTNTKVSLWRIPNDVMPGVIEFERWEKEAQEKKANAKWAEEQLKEIRPAKPVAEDIGGTKSRRRRSESLQREDEAALMAELAAEATHDDDAAYAISEPTHSVLSAPRAAVYDSDSSYEEVEVTDSEGEEVEEKPTAMPAVSEAEPQPESEMREDAPVEFGEDDIAYQLAAMNQDYEEEFDEYADGTEYIDEDAEGLDSSAEAAAAIFREMLDDHGISPFTPWEKLIADDSEASIVHDDRYTLLPTMRARRETWDVWVRDTAARLHQERAAAEKQDPKLPFLAFLHQKATPKLYWPEFKRKFKREPEMNDRKLSDKDREKLYRDHISRLKLPEKTRKADLEILLKEVPLNSLNRNTALADLPQTVQGHLHFISLPAETRDKVITSYIRGLPILTSH